MYSWHRQPAGICAAGVLASQRHAQGRRTTCPISININSLKPTARWCHLKCAAAQLAFCCSQLAGRCNLRANASYLISDAYLTNTYLPPYLQCARLARPVAHGAGKRCSRQTLDVRVPTLALLAAAGPAGDQQASKHRDGSC